LGEHKEALEAFRTGLAQARPAENGAHLYLAASYIESLIALDRVAQACIEGEKLVATAEAADFGPLTHRLLEAVAKAHAIKGEHERAKQLADRAIERLEEFDAYGLVLGGAYETRARVALAEGDQETFDEHVEKCAMIYRADQQPMMAARYSALLRLAISRNRLDGEAQVRAIRDSTPISKFASSEMTTIDRRSERTFRTKRMESALKTLVEAATAVGGYLFTMQQKGPVLSAKFGGFDPPANLRTSVESFLSAEIDSAEEVELGSADEAAADAPFCWIADDGGRYYPSLLTHHTRIGPMVNGVVVLRSRDTRPVYAPYQLCVELSKTLESSTDIKTSLAAT
jgi:tetratricopeptide (TPR) repeat protein